MNDGVNFNRENKEVKRLAHDLRNIFNIILTSVESLKSGTGNTKSLINTIEANTIRATEIFESALSPGKIPEPRKINAVSVINEVLSDARKFLPKEIIVEFRNSNSDYRVNANLSELYRAFNNLILNSIEALGDSGNIRISIEKHNADDLIEIVFEDDGPGISSENLSKIFEEGFSTKNKNYEAGIGLASVKKIVENYNGTIKAESVIGEWTKFKVCFPEVKVPTKKAPINKTIMVVDDEDVIRELLSDLFVSMDYKVAQAENGEEAVAQIEKRNDIDLIIIDKKMPTMDGIQAIEILRERGFSKPIILASGSVSDTKLLNKEKLQVEGIVQKPFSFEQLAEIVSLYLPD